MTEIVTFGCRLNLSESDAIAGLTRAAGLVDTIVVNTCAVTAEAERQARQAIRRLRRERPGATIVVTGCAAQLDPAHYQAMPEVDHVLGNAEKTDVRAWAALARDCGSGARSVADDVAAGRDSPSHRMPGLTGRHTRAFVEMQHGCDHRCTFCVIPLVRGPSRSRPLDALIAEVRGLADRGASEVVLTGVDITAWGADLPQRLTLGQGVRAVLANVPRLRRLRLSSLDPAEIDETLWQALADEPRLMPHLHLSVQSGDDLILKRMKRRHARSQVIDASARARALRPGLALGADLIAGFPTETSAMFESTLRLVEEAGVDFVHAFPFSPRPGTPAARMPQIDRAEVAARARRLRQAGDRALRAFLARRLGGRAAVLVERNGRSGHCEHFARVSLDRAVAAGTIVTATLLAVDGDRLSGRVDAVQAAA